MSPTLEQLEGAVWGEPSFDSDLAQTCHRLRKKPLSEFTAGDLRVMIGQNIGTRFLMPLALDVVEDDPMAEGDYYPGDLLMNVIQVPEAYWSAHPGELERARIAAERFVAVMHAEWAQRANEAFRLYGAQIDGRERHEEKLVVGAQGFVNTHPTRQSPGGADPSPPSG